MSRRYSVQRAFMSFGNESRFVVDQRGQKVCGIVEKRDKDSLIPHIAACLNLLDGVPPEAFPAIEDWLKERGFKPM